MSTESARLQTSISDSSGVSVIRIAGEVDIYTAPDFKSTLDEAIIAGARDLVVDMAEVTYMDSSGFGTLLSATKRLKPEGGSISLAKCNDAIERMLRITRLDSIFGIFPQVDDAVKFAKTRMEQGKTASH
ncbi:MAG TPA: STAS domain-containing protein [Armatimonadota bacterium]